MANITINDTPTRAQYVATSLQTVFSYTFPIKEDSDLQVYQRIAGSTPDDAADLLTLTTDYTVTGANTAAGGTVVLVTGATLNDIVTIVGDKPIDRTAIYDQSVTLSKADLNNDFNDEVMFDKQIETIADQITPKYNRNELVGNGVRPDKLILPMLAEDEVWVGRGAIGQSPDDIIAIDVYSLIDFNAQFVLGTASANFPSAQVLGGLGEGIMYNEDNGTTGTIAILNTGSGLTLNTTTNTLAVTGTGAFLDWSLHASSSTMLTMHGYIANSSGLVSYALPTTSAIGDMVIIIGKGSGGWTIGQATNQQIHMGDQSTTIGGAGSISSINRRDNISLVCTNTNLEWTVFSSQGQVTII